LNGHALTPGPEWPGSLNCQPVGYTAAFRQAATTSLNGPRGPYDRRVRLTLALVLVCIGAAFCVFGGYFAAMGVFHRSPDNAVINYVLLAVPPLALGALLVALGRRAVREEKRRIGKNAAD
jgi:hypothetical protein